MVRHLENEQDEEEIVISREFNELNVRNCEGVDLVGYSEVNSWTGRKIRQNPSSKYEL